MASYELELLPYKFSNEFNTHRIGLRVQFSSLFAINLGYNRNKLSQGIEFTISKLSLKALRYHSVTGLEDYPYVSQRTILQIALSF